jgi:hypothetical protein
MDWPYQFPDPADVIAREAERFRALPPAEQLREILELAEFGYRQIEASSRRDAVLAQIEAAETEWQRVHRELFARHGY